MKRPRESAESEDIQVIVDDHGDTQVDVDDDEDPRFDVIDHTQVDDDDADIEAMRNYLMEAMQNGNRSSAAGDEIIEEPESEPMVARPITTIVEDDSALPDQPPLKTRFAAIKYKGCNFYWGGERRYRVLYKPNSATKNLHWKTEEEAAEVWCMVIGFCIEHAH